MFATILFGLFIILCIGIIIAILHDHTGDNLLSPIATIFIVSLALGVSLVRGYKEPDLERKREVEILLTVEVSAENISKAQKYNESVNKNNNLWNRFTIEDRSEYLIDIDYYINLAKEA